MCLRLAGLDPARQDIRIRNADLHIYTGYQAPTITVPLGVTFVIGSLGYYISIQSDALVSRKPQFYSIRNI